MGTLANNPVALMLVAPVAGGLAFGGIARLSVSSLPAQVVASLVFLIAYVATYRKVPGFPPLGSTNKIFYLALFGMAFGLALDVAARGTRSPAAASSTWAGAAWAAPSRRGAEIAWAFAIALWIGWPRFAEPDAGLLVTVIGLGIGGSIVLWRLDAVGSAASADGGEMVATAMLAALAAGFAPVALFGASSTSFGLCLGLAAGLAIVALIALAVPRRFGACAAFGAGGGLLAIVDTVALITEQIDFAALVVLLAVTFAGQIGARLLLSPGRFDPRIRQVLIGLMAASPIAVVLAILLLRHPNPLGA